MPGAHDKEYQVTRANGSKLHVTVGSDIEGKSGKLKVELNEYGNLSIGDHTVVVGENVLPGLSANRKGKSESEYFIYSDNKGGRRVSVTVGERNEEFGMIGKDNFGNLTTDNGTVKLLHKEKELRLLVLDDEMSFDNDSGNKAYINVYRPGNDRDQLKGVQGVYIKPAKSSDPGLFMEDNGAGEGVITAKFHSSKNGRSASVELRGFEDAVIEHELTKKVEFLETRAALAEIDPRMLQNYDRLSEELKEVKSQPWEEQRFVVSSGAENMLVQRPRQEYSNTNYTPRM